MKVGRKEMIKIVLFVVYIVLTVTGVTLMKLGGNSGTIAIKEGLFNFNISLISMLGFVCYICSFLLFTRLVLMFDLSYFMPISAGITQIFSLIVAYSIFKEDISIQAVIGASFIILGIIAMNWKR